MDWVWYIFKGVWIRCVSFQANALTGKASVETYDHRRFDGLRWRKIGFGGIICE